MHYMQTTETTPIRPETGWRVRQFCCLPDGLFSWLHFYSGNQTVYGGKKAPLDYKLYATTTWPQIESVKYLWEKGEFGHFRPAEYPPLSEKWSLIKTQ